MDNDKCTICGNYVCSHVRVTADRVVASANSRKPRKSTVVKLNTELAIPIGINDGTRVGGYRKPRVSQRFSPVKITRADGSISVMTKAARTYNGRRTEARVIDIPRHIMAADLPALFAD